MKAEGKAKWFIDALMEFILDRDAELAENKDFSSQLKEFVTSLKPAKKVKARKPRAPKALPYDVPPMSEKTVQILKEKLPYTRINGADTEDHAN